MSLRPKFRDSGGLLFRRVGVDEEVITVARVKTSRAGALALTNARDDPTGNFATFYTRRGANGQIRRLANVLNFQLELFFLASFLANRMGFL